MARTGASLPSLFELGKRGFTTCLFKVPTYKTLYGAFSDQLSPVYSDAVLVSYDIVRGG